AGPPALRPDRAGRDRAPPADPAVPCALAARRPDRVPRAALGPLKAAAPRLRPRGRDRMRLRLQGVVERLEARRLASRPVRDCLREQPVGEPRVPREERAVEVRADRAADAAALVAALAVIAEPRDNPAERLGALVEDRP